MNTIADLEVSQLEAHLVSGGFLTSFTDIYGDAQPAPVVQLDEIDETKISNNARAVMIRTTGNITNASTRYQYKERNMLIVVLGNQGKQDRVVIKGLADAMEEWLVANPQDGGCIFNIVSSGVNGPFIYDSSRRAYEINLSVSFNINRPAFTIGS